MTWEKSFAELIESYFNERKLKNPKFSMRALAIKLDISIGSLSDLLSHKRPLSLKGALRVLEALQVPQDRKNKVLSLMGRPLIIERRDLQQSQYAIVSEWIYSAVLVYFELSGVDCSVHGASQYLGLTEPRTQEIVDYLIAENLLEEREGQLCRKELALQMSDGPPSALVRARHLVNLDLAKHAVENCEPAKRDVTNLMFAGNSSQLEQLRQEIRQLYVKTTAIMEGDERNEIYALTIALHPVTKEVHGE